MFENFFPENRVVDEIMWKNVERNRPQMSRIVRMLDTNTHTHTHERARCVILIAFPLKQWLHARTLMLRYTFIACLVSFIKLHSIRYHVTSDFTS
jgi:hypothetical protein